MLKILVFLLCATLVSTSDTCRKSVPLSPTGTCGLKQTMYNEGGCLCCYYDTNNIPTIGAGFNLQRGDARQVMARYNLNLEDVLNDCTHKTTDYCLTAANAEDLFNTIIYPEFENCVDNYVPNLPKVKRAALIDVAFAGCATLNMFVNMQGALKQQDWNTVAAELRNSPWCKQVGPTRCASNYNCIADNNDSMSPVPTSTPSFTVSPSSSPTSTCKGQTCGNFTNSCSSNRACSCFQTSNGTGFCGIGDTCNTLSDCSLCSPLTSVCLVNTCCPGPICVPLSDNQPCTNPPTYRISKSDEPLSLRRSLCRTDQDCESGKVCTLHMVGSFCV